MRHTILLALCLSCGPAFGQVPLLLDRGGTGSISFDSFPVSGVPLTIFVEFDFDVEEASIHIRPIAASEPYTELVGTPEQGDLRSYRVTVAGSLLPPRGVEFYLSYLSDGVQFTFPETDPELFPFRTATLTPRIRADVLLAPFRYRMISIPFEFDESMGSDFGGGTLQAVFEDDYGPYDPSRWRVFRWSPSALQYLEADEAVPHVRAGHAFWLITATGADFDVEGGFTPGFELLEGGIDEVPVRVNAQPGWNQIGNPFLYAIDWGEVENSGLLDEPIGFGPAGYQPAQTVLAPWAGYFVFNPTSSTVQLAFRPPPAQAAPQAVRPFAEVTLDAMRAHDVLVRIEAIAGEFRDEHTYLGVAGESRRADVRQPPSIAGELAVAVIDDEGAWLSRFRSHAEAPSWTIRLEAAWPTRRPVTVRLHELASAPSRAVVVRDPLTGEQLPTPGGQFSTSLGGERSTVYYTVEIIPESDVTAPALDERLGSPFPNPASSSAVVTLHAWAEEGAVLEVYDLLGRRVATLADGFTGTGWQEVTWDLQDEGGRAVPAGLYFLRYRSGPSISTTSLTVIR